MMSAGATTAIDVSTLANGSYLVKVFSDKGSSAARFIKQ
jgi:hypothetical protein